MKLELGCVQINDIQFASESKVENGTIYVNAEELKALLLEDENLKSVELEIAKPGECPYHASKGRDRATCKSQRRWKLIPRRYFQGGDSGKRKDQRIKRVPQLLPQVRLLASRKVSSTCAARGAKYTPFSQLNNLVVVCEPIDGLAKHAHEKAVRFAGLKAADYIGKLAKDVEPDEVKVYETCSVKEGIEKYPELQE